MPQSSIADEIRSKKGAAYYAYIPEGSQAQNLVRSFVRDEILRTLRSRPTYVSDDNCTIEEVMECEGGFKRKAFLLPSHEFALWLLLRLSSMPGIEAELYRLDPACFNAELPRLHLYQWRAPATAETPEYDSALR